MAAVFNIHNKLRKMAKLLKELDGVQADMERVDNDASEDIRWCRIFLSNAMSSLNLYRNS